MSLRRAQVAGVPRFLRAPSPLVLLALLLIGPGLGAQSRSFQRGDVNGDAVMNLTDSVFLGERIFLSTEPLLCSDSADLNDDGVVNLTDVIAGARFLFLGDAPPAPPFGACGTDATSDDLSCDDFPPCADVDVPCLDSELLEGLVDDLDLLLGFELCLPAGLLQVPLDGLEIVVCPEDSAAPCGLGGQPGCPVELTGFAPLLDVPGRTVGLRVSGRVVDLPIDVTEGLFNSTTTCLNDLHGSEGADAPFSFDILLPLVVEELADGELEITGVEGGRVDNLDIVLDSSGGLVCILFEAGQGAFLELLVAPIEALLGDIGLTLGEEIVGLRICE